MNAPAQNLEGGGGRGDVQPEHTMQGASANYDRLPTTMRNALRWLLWKAVPNPDPTKKPRKIPYYACGVPRSGGLDSPADQARFVSFDEAFAALQSGGYAGLGFALGPDGTGNCWQGIDLDDLSIHPELHLIAQQLPGYTEASPSGEGKHAIGYGRSFESLGSNATGIEAYSSGRYFTVTAVAAGLNPPICLADFVEQRLLPLHGSRPGKLSPNDPAATPEVVAEQTVVDLRSALLSMRSDDRDLWVRMGLALKTLSDVGRGLWMEWSATSDKFDPQDAARTWDSFKPTRTGYQVVFSEAQRNGWVNPQRSLTPAPDSGIFGTALPPMHGIPASVDLDPVATLEKNIVPMISVVDQANCFMPHFVDMWIPHNQVTLLAGHGGGGKSYVALSISVHVALGRQFGNLGTTQANVLFFSGEDDSQVLRQRLARICRALNIDPMQLDGKLHLLDASDIDPALYRERRVGLYGFQQTVTETPLLDTLALLVKKLDVGLVVIDNASDTYDGDEIKRASVRAFVRSLRQRIARPGRAVLLLAHINKESAKGGRSAGSEDYSGSTAWHNSVRSRLSLIPDGDNALKIEHVKVNYGIKAAPVGLEWRAGVPLVAGSFLGAGAAADAIARTVEKARDEADKAALVSLIQDFDRRGEHVNTAAQGGYSTFKLIKTHPDYPKNTGSDRLTVLMRQLETEGRIYRRAVITDLRKRKQVFTCVPVPGSAPMPVIETAPTGNEQVVTCAN